MGSRGYAEGRGGSQELEVRSGELEELAEKCPFAVILSPSSVILSPSFFILSEAKDPFHLTQDKLPVARSLLAARSARGPGPTDHPDEDYGIAGTGRATAAR